MANFSFDFSRRTFMQWAGGTALLGGLLGQRALAALSVPFVDIALTVAGTGLWKMDQMGKITPLGTAPALAEFTTTKRPTVFKSMVNMPAGSQGAGGVVALTMGGDIRTFGFSSKGLFEPTTDERHIIPCVKIARTSDGYGLWGIDLMGNLHTWGSAPVLALGTPPEPTRSPFVALVAAPDDLGLYALTMDGELKTYGATTVLGSPPDPMVPAPYVALAITPDGAGLYALTMDGQIRTFGAAPVLGTPPEPIKPSPYAALLTTPSGLGLYALTMDGSLRTLGDALNFSAPLP